MSIESVILNLILIYLMNEEKKFLSYEDSLNYNIKNENDKISIEINKTETTQENESLNHNIENNEINNIEEIRHNNKKEITDKLKVNLQESNNNLKKSNNFNNPKIIENEKQLYTNNISKFKSSLKGSKNKISDIKKQIMKIFEEDKIDNMFDNFKTDYNPINLDEIYKFQETYENKMDKIFNDKIDKIDEINEKYNSDLNELNYYIEQEKKEEKNENEKSVSVTKIMYDEIALDKNKELNDLEKNYEENIDILNKEYFEDLNSGQNVNCLKEIFGNIKNEIVKIIKPKNNKTVSFDCIDSK